MTNFQFLQRYEQLQTGIMFDKIIDINFATISLCNKDDGSFWNRALINSEITKDQLLEIEKEMDKIERTPSFYFENRDDLKPLINFLNDNKYKIDYEDSWMFWTNKEIDRNGFKKIKKVTNEEELKIFLTTFNNCYQNDDPQNPYGELGDYLKVTEDVWYQNNDKDKLEYFIVYDNNEPVAVTTLTNFSGIGYISNVGSLRSVRGKGFGKLATLFCVEESKKHGNTEHCLATEEGDYPNEFYKRIGFETKFNAIGLIKKD